MKIARRPFALSAGPRLQPNREPLYRRLPSRDEHGGRLVDFMMLLPGLADLPAAALEPRLEHLHALLARRDDVVFADLNTALNLLWVSLRARHGAIVELADEIRTQLPRARLVGHALPAPRRQRRGRLALGQLRALLKF